MSEKGARQGLVPAGWHPDPSGVAVQRYWDGSSWTTHVVDHYGQQRDELATQQEVKLPPIAEQSPRAPGPAAAPHSTPTLQTHFAQQSVHHSTVVMSVPKSRGLAFLLTFLFGPLGMLYSTVVGGIVMFLVSIVLIPITLGLAAIVLWPACIIWGVLACPSSTATTIQTSHISGTGTSF